MTKTEDTSKVVSLTSKITRIRRMKHPFTGKMETREVDENGNPYMTDEEAFKLAEAFKKDREAREKKPPVFENLAELCSHYNAPLEILDESTALHNLKMRSIRNDLYNTLNIARIISNVQETLVDRNYPVLEQVLVMFYAYVNGIQEAKEDSRLGGLGATKKNHLQKKIDLIYIGIPAFLKVNDPKRYEQGATTDDASAELLKIAKRSFMKAVQGLKSGLYKPDVMEEASIPVDKYTAQDRYDKFLELIKRADKYFDDADQEVRIERKDFDGYKI
jgi:hypothetical protein